MFARHALVALLLPLASPAPGQEPVRFDIAGFALPPGWTKEARGQQLVLRPTAHAITVTVAKSEPLEGSVAQQGQRALDEAGKLPEFRLEAQPNHGRHPKSRGQWHSFVYSHAHPEQQGKYRYAAVFHVGAGGRCIAFTLTTDDPAAYEATRTTVGALIDGVELSTTQRLERGVPPLTRFMVDETIDFLEWLVHSPMTEEQRGTVESELRRFWQEKVKDEMDGILEVLSARTELAKLGEAERELARQAILEQAVEEWRKDAGSTGAKMLLAIHAAANEPIAQGEPPLTRQAVDAFAEFLAFAAGQVAGCEGKLPKDLRDELAKGIADGYPGLAKEERETIAGMPMVWAALRVVWPDLPAEQKQSYVDGWRQSKTIADLGAGLRQQQEKAREIERAAASMRDTLRQQAQMQAQQMHFRMMQNVMQSQFDTMRIISSNMGGNTQWVYRW